MTEIICVTKWRRVAAVIFLTFICYAETISLIISINSASFPTIIRQAFKIMITPCRLLFYFIANLISHWVSFKQLQSH
jgi:hypothetical protein